LEAKLNLLADGISTCLTRLASLDVDQ